MKSSLQRAVMVTAGVIVSNMVLLPTAVRAELSPEAYEMLKDNAEEVHVVEVTSVDESFEGAQFYNHFLADAIVLRVIRTTDGFDVNDTIHFETYWPKPNTSAPSDHPAPPEVLEVGWCGRLYLNQDFFNPYILAAFGESFEEGAEECLYGSSSEADVIATDQYTLVISPEIPPHLAGDTEDPPGTAESDDNTDVENSEADGEDAPVVGQSDNSTTDIANDADHPPSTSPPSGTMPPVVGQSDNGTTDNANVTDHPPSTSPPSRTVPPVVGQSDNGTTDIANDTDYPPSTSPPSRTVPPVTDNTDVPVTDNTKVPVTDNTEVPTISPSSSEGVKATLCSWIQMVVTAVVTLHFCWSGVSRNTLFAGSAVAILVLAISPTARAELPLEAFEEYLVLNVISVETLNVTSELNDLFIGNAAVPGVNRTTAGFMINDTLQFETYFPTPGIGQPTGPAPPQKIVIGWCDLAYLNVKDSYVYEPAAYGQSFEDGAQECAEGTNSPETMTPTISGAGLKSGHGFELLQLLPTGYIFSV